MANASDSLREVSRRLKAAPQGVVDVAAKTYADAVRKQLRADGSRIAGAKLSVKIEPHGSITVVTAAPRKAIGPWSILDSGTRAHTVRARRGRDSEAMNIPGVGWRQGPWRVSGVGGHHTWAKAMAKAKPDAMRDAQRLVSEAVHGR